MAIPDKSIFGYLTADNKWRQRTKAALDIVDVGAAPAAHAPSHLSGQSDPLTVFNTNSPTHTELQDYINTLGSAGKISGGDANDNGNGTVEITAGTGMIKSSDSNSE